MQNELEYCKAMAKIGSASWAITSEEWPNPHWKSCIDNSHRVSPLDLHECPDMGGWKVSSVLLSLLTWCTVQLYAGLNFKLFSHLTRFDHIFGITINMNSSYLYRCYLKGSSDTYLRSTGQYISSSRRLTWSYILWRSNSKKDDLMDFTLAVTSHSAGISAQREAVPCDRPKYNCIEQQFMRKFSPTFQLDRWLERIRIYLQSRDESSSAYKL